MLALIVAAFSGRFSASLGRGEASRAGVFISPEAGTRWHPWGSLGMQLLGSTPRFWKARGCVLEPDCSQGVSMEPWEFSRWDFQRGFKQRGNKNLAGVEGRMLFINSEENKAAPCVTKGGAGAPQEHQGR